MSNFDDTTEEENESLPKMYMKAGHLVELDKFACTHGPGRSCWFCGANLTFLKIG